MSERKKCKDCKYFVRYREIIDNKLVLMKFGFCKNGSNNVRKMKIYTLTETCPLWDDAKDQEEEFYRRLEEALKREELSRLRKELKKNKNPSDE